MSYGFNISLEALMPIFYYIFERSLPDLAFWGCWCATDGAASGSAVPQVFLSASQPQSPTLILIFVCKTQQSVLHTAAVPKRRRVSSLRNDAPLESRHCCWPHPCSFFLLFRFFIWWTRWIYRVLLDPWRPGRPWWVPTRERARSNCSHERLKGGASHISSWETHYVHGLPLNRKKKWFYEENHLKVVKWFFRTASSKKSISKSTNKLHTSVQKGKNKMEKRPILSIFC